MRQLIVTVGPELLKDRSVLKLIHQDSNVYRINGAHGSLKILTQTLSDIRREIPNARILLDLPGNKIRCRLKHGAMVIHSGESFSLGPQEFNYPEFHKFVKPGDRISVGDGTLKFLVTDVQGGAIVFQSEHDGTLLSNKGLHLPGIATRLPFLFQHDLDLIAWAVEFKIPTIALSFVRSMADISWARSVIPKEINLIPKIETLSAFQRLREILPNVDTILVDRGDLANEVGIERLPAHQRHIIEKAHLQGCKVILATQFLSSMENHPTPRIPEIIDLYNTLKMGVDGIQLSEETAIGKFPRQCLDIINRMREAILSEGIETERIGRQVEEHS